MKTLGHQPSDRCVEVLREVGSFLDEVAEPEVARCEQEVRDPFFALEPDGSLATPLLELKRRLQRLSAEHGLYCPNIPKAVGGLGLGLVDCFHIQEAVYRRGLRGHQWMLAWTDGPSPLLSSWSAEAHEHWRDDFVGGRINVAFALTEPDAGSDVTGIASTARRTSDGWAISGTKHLITGAPHARLAHVVARREGAATGELTTFLVPLDAPGVTRGSVQQTIMADGQTGSLAFEDVRVPAWSVVGAVDEGLPLAFRWINWARTRRGGMCTGLAQHCFERSSMLAHERKVFGAPIADLGAVADMLSDMALQVEAMRAFSLELLARLDTSSCLDGDATADDRRHVSMLKVWNDEALFRVADLAVQVHGGRGVLSEHGIEKIFRVARSLRIPAGTTEVQRATIARTL